MLALLISKGNKKGDCMKVIGYTDDAAIICKVSIVEEVSSMLNTHLEKIRKWVILNRVKFNHVKLAVLIISNRQNKPLPAAIYYDNVLIIEVTSYKYLGLWVNNKFSWSVYIDSVINKLGMVMRLLRGLSRENWGIQLDIYKLLFYAIFVLVMTYGIGIWGWKVNTKTMYIKFYQEIRKFALLTTRCQRSTSSTYIFNLLKTQSFSHILKYEVLTVSVQQFHVLHIKRQMAYENYQKRRKKKEIPQCMDYQFFMYRREIENKICEVEYDDVNEQYYVHSLKWAYTNIIVQELIKVRT